MVTLEGWSNESKEAQIRKAQVEYQKRHCDWTDLKLEQSFFDHVTQTWQHHVTRFSPIVHLLTFGTGLSWYADGVVASVQTTGWTRRSGNSRFSWRTAIARLSLIRDAHRSLFAFSAFKSCGTLQRIRHMHVKAYVLLSCTRICIV